MSKTLICDVTNDMGFLYSLFQYKSDCTNVAKVIAFDRFQIMARDLTSIAAMTLFQSPAEFTTGSRLIDDGSMMAPWKGHNGSTMGPKWVHTESKTGLK